MHFQKLSNNSLRCTISADEMSEKGFRIDDLMDNREKAEDFLRYILQEARYAVDFRTNGNVLNVQLSVMPGGDLSLMISDDEDSAIRNILSEMKNHLENLRAAREEGGDNSTAQNDTEDGNSRPSADGSEWIHAAADGDDDIIQNADDVMELPLWVQLDSLEECIHLAGKLPEVRDAKSELYKYDEQYFLVIHLKMTRKKLAGIAFKAAEYANGMYADVPGVAEIMEHGITIRKGHALRDLAELA